MLSGLAGFVDAVGFINLKGYFVSFMSGNSTRLGISMGSLNFAEVLTVSGLLLAFLFGVVSGSLLTHFARRQRVTVVLFYVATLLVFSAVSYLAEKRFVGGLLQVVAMGSLNMVFSRKGDVAVGLTYMTGALVRTGKHIARAFLGGPRWSFLPYLLLWVGLVCGAALGASLQSIGVPACLTLCALYAIALVPLANKYVKVRRS